MSQGTTDATPKVESRVTPSSSLATPTPPLPDVPLDWPRVVRFLAFVVAAAILLGAFFILYQALLLPIGVSAFLSYLLLPLVDRLTRWGINRVLAVSVMVFGFVAAMSIAVFRVAPQLYWQAWQLIKLIPGAFNTVSQIWLPIVENFVVELDILEPGDVHRWFTVGNLLVKIESQLQAALTGVWDTGATLLGGVVNVVLIPLFTFFLLLDWPNVARVMRSLIPRDLLAPCDELSRRVNQTLRSVLKGQVIVALILAVLYVVGLSIVGLKAAVVIGLVAGICRIIPYLDVIVGGTLSLIVVLSDFHSMSQIATVAIVFLVVQVIDGMVVTPRVIGERVGLHPAVVIVSVLAFADWFGFWGVLLAVPVVAIAKAVLTAAKPFYLASHLYERVPSWSDLAPKGAANLSAEAARAPAESQDHLDKDL